MLTFVRINANLLMRREIIFYTTEDGKCPVKNFLDSLPEKAFQKKAWILRMIWELDIIPSRYFKKLTDTDDIWECRIKQGNSLYRLLCFFANGSIIILTNGFQKKSQKTPANEIETVKKSIKKTT